MSKFFSNYELVFLNKIDDVLYRSIENESKKTDASIKRPKKTEEPRSDIKFDVYRYMSMTSLDEFERLSGHLFINYAKYFSIPSWDTTSLFVKYILGSEIAARMNKTRVQLQKTDVINSEGVPIFNSEFVIYAVHNMIPFVGEGSVKGSKAYWDNKNGLKYKYYSPTLSFIYTNGVGYVSDHVSLYLHNEYRKSGSFDFLVIEKYDLDYDGYKEKLKRLYIKKLNNVYKEHIDAYRSYLNTKNFKLLKIEFDGDNIINFYFESKHPNNIELKEFYNIIEHMAHNVFGFNSKILNLSKIKNVAHLKLVQ